MAECGLGAGFSISAESRLASFLCLGMGTAGKVGMVPSSCWEV